MSIHNGPSRNRTTSTNITTLLTHARSGGAACAALFKMRSWEVLGSVMVDPDVLLYGVRASPFFPDAPEAESEALFQFQLVRQHVINSLSKHALLQDDGEEEDGLQTEATRHGERVVAAALERLCDADEQHVHEGEDEGRHQLVDATGKKDHGKAHEHELLPRLNQLPPKEVALVVTHEEAERRRQGSWFIVQDCAARGKDQDGIEN